MKKITFYFTFHGIICTSTSPFPGISASAIFFKLGFNMSVMVTSDFPGLLPFEEQDHDPSVFKKYHLITRRFGVAYGKIIPFFSNQLKLCFKFVFCCLKIICFNFSKLKTCACFSVFHRLDLSDFLEEEPYVGDLSLLVGCVF